MKQYCTTTFIVIICKRYALEIKLPQLKLPLIFLGKKRKVMIYILLDCYIYVHKELLIGEVAMMIIFSSLCHFSGFIILCMCFHKEKPGNTK
jgi:hypothetical protein